MPNAFGDKEILLAKTVSVYGSHDLIGPLDLVRYFA